MLFDLLKENKDKINWLYLSKNPNALDLLSQNIDKINLLILLENSNPKIIDLINKHLITKIKKSSTAFEILSANPNAIEILKNNKKKIDWFELSINPSIFKLI